MDTNFYRGRFAPSPTGPLHMGSLVAALGSWLDARAHGGQWLVRIEDVDTPRTVPGAAERILQQLNACGLNSDEPVVLQSARSALYQQALDGLVGRGLAYHCTCSRKDIAAALHQLGLERPRHGELVYPGTCRPRAGSPPGTDIPHIGYKSCAWRLRTDLPVDNWPLAPVEYTQVAITLIAISTIHWQDRQLGAQQQDVAREVGDFVLQRSDGCFTYQLAVVVDDAAQSISHVVRGVDLADNTARQILLQRVLGLPTPRYLHTPLVLGSNGEKLSKQNGAQAIDTSTPQAAMHALSQAAGALGLAPTHHGAIAEALLAWTDAWQSSYCR
jgi:glutamyl-Q tRNA(Asp) synthetase